MRVIGLVLIGLILAGCAGTGRQAADPDVPAFLQEDLPGGLQQILGQARSLANDDSFDQADELLESANERYGEYPQIELNRALLDIRQDDFDDAMEHVDAALSIRPEYPPALNLKGYISRLEGEFEQAKQSYQKAINVEPKYAKPYLNLGILADLYLQDYILALTSFEQYLDLVESDEKVSGWIVELKRRIPEGNSE